MMVTENRFKKTQLERWTPLSHATIAETAESKYWNRGQVRLAETLTGAVTGCAFAPSTTRGVVDGSPTLRLACTSSLNVLVFGISTVAGKDPSKKTLGKFSSPCHGCGWRADGRLVSAGDGFGGAQVIDATTGAVLRTLGKGRKRNCCRTTAWGPSSAELATGCDDGTVSLWDVTTGDRTHSSAMHGAEVKSVCFYSRNVWVSGGLDGVVAAWDDRTPTKKIFSLDHGAPVECLTIGDDLAASAGGHKVTLWDLGQQRRAHDFEDAHSKSASCVSFCSGGSRLLSGGADCVLKAHSLKDWSSTRVARFDSPLLCVDCSSEDLLFAVGTASGRVEARLRVTGTTLTSANKQSRRQTLNPPPGTYRHFQRGKAYTPPEADSGVVYVADIIQANAAPHGKKPKLQPYDEALRKFRYGDALDAALDTRDPAVVVSVLSELTRRGGIRSALSHRDEARLEPLLAFLAAHVANPKCAPRLLKVINHTLDQYLGAIGSKPNIDELFYRIARNVKNEAETQRALLKLSGTVQALKSSSAPSKA